jgi:hypothetical protein
MVGETSVDEVSHSGKIRALHGLTTFAQNLRFGQKTRDAQDLPRARQFVRSPETPPVRY